MSLFIIVLGLVARVGRRDAPFFLSGAIARSLANWSRACVRTSRASRRAQRLHATAQQPRQLHLQRDASPWRAKLRRAPARAAACAVEGQPLSPVAVELELQLASCLASHRHSRRRAGVQNRPARPLHTALPAKSGGPVSNSCDATATMAEIASATMPAGEMPKPRRQKKVFKPPSDADVCKVKVRSPVYISGRVFENWSGRAQRAAAATSLDAAGAPRPDTAA